jgi:hypothetical protein
MAILTLQRRSRELGRIRIGQQVATGTEGKMRPAKLDKFRLTSASRPLLEKAAALYGGEVVEWNNGGSAQFEVFTTATRLPVLVPPQPVSQFFELWSGGGCQRRCDGERELLTDQACLCSPDPEDRACKPTTRLNVVLRDVEGVGVWRLESHGYYAATELPSTAEFLAQASGYIAGCLSLEARTVLRDGKTKRFVVPIIEVDVTPAALMAGGGGITALASAAAAAVTPALPVTPPVTLAEVQAAASLEELRAIYTRARDGGQRDDKALAAAVRNRAGELDRAKTEPATEAPSAEASAAPVDTTPTRDQFAKMHAQLAECGVTEAERHATLGTLVGRLITSANELTSVEAGSIIELLGRCTGQAEPARALDHYLANLDTGNEATT